jgi:hypothetical protein
MSNARNLANIVTGNFDVPLGALDNVPPSNDASALTTGTLPVGRLPSSGVDAGSLTAGTLATTRLAANAAKESLVGIGNIYAGLPLAYIRLIQSRDQSKIYWCAPASAGGSDSNSGTYASPWLNPYYAVKQISDGSTLILKAGTYTYTDQDCRLTGDTSNRRGIVLSDGYTTSVTNIPTTNRGVAFIGYPNQTILIGTSVTTGQPASDWRDFGMIGLFNYNSVAVGITIKRDNGGRTNGYSTAIWGPDCAPYVGTALNCVFVEINANGCISNSYNNENTNYFNMDNCTILNPGNPANYLSSYSGGNFGGHLCAFQGTNGNTHNYLNGKSFNHLTFDADLRVIGGAVKDSYSPFESERSAVEIGVYGGKYAWGAV